MSICLRKCFISNSCPLESWLCRQNKGDQTSHKASRGCLVQGPSRQALGRLCLGPAPEGSLGQQGKLTEEGWGPGVGVRRTQGRLEDTGRQGG